MKYLLISMAIVASSLVAFGSSTKTDIPGRTEVLSFPLSTNSSELGISPVLNDAVQNDSMCTIYIPPLERNCANQEQSSGCDNFSEQKGQYNNCHFFLLTCNCATYNKKKNLLEYGRCIYNCGYHKKRLSQEYLDWNDEVCGEFHRQGSLCGSCQVNTYLMAYSYNLTCVKCGRNYKLN